MGSGDRFQCVCADMSFDVLREPTRGFEVLSVPDESGRTGHLLGWLWMVFVAREYQGTTL